MLLYYCKLNANKCRQWVVYKMCVNYITFLVSAEKRNTSVSDTHNQWKLKGKFMISVPSVWCASETLWLFDDKQRNPSIATYYQYL
jgi:hypothetical protein